MAGAGRPDRTDDVGVIGPNGPSCLQRLLGGLGYTSKYLALADNGTIQAHIAELLLSATRDGGIAGMLTLKN